MPPPPPRVREQHRHTTKWHCGGCRRPHGYQRQRLRRRRCRCHFRPHGLRHRDGVAAGSRPPTARPWVTAPPAEGGTGACGWPVTPPVVARHPPSPVRRRPVAAATDEPTHWRVAGHHRSRPLPRGAVATTTGQPPPTGRAAAVAAEGAAVEAAVVEAVAEVVVVVVATDHHSGAPRRPVHPLAVAAETAVVVPPPTHTRRGGSGGSTRCRRRRPCRLRPAPPISQKGRWQGCPLSPPSPSPEAKAPRLQRLQRTAPPYYSQLRPSLPPPRPHHGCPPSPHSPTARRCRGAASRA